MVALDLCLGTDHCIFEGGEEKLGSFLGLEILFSPSNIKYKINDSRKNLLNRCISHGPPPSAPSNKETKLQETKK